ncbi:hypothetical protein QBZ16_005038 [Prototheca wickerhamii]|uniref:CP-type G domain-containing protein n=1 Tax=Prototheca wickerhamii TaxID=3111 RepID=A0AAD9IIM6_PROWI|nr:hypothetical protein QBZ16_005038 [Prototheca wickerhamii]
MPVDFKIHSPAHFLVHEVNGQSQDSFHLEDTQDGDYKLCFTATDFQAAQRTRIRVEWKSGSAAHDWESVAKRDNLNFLQTELLNLEQAIHDIHIELQRIRRKEEEMRDLNDVNMPKKSKKSKSRRTTLRQKYKILRKVREHHRKKRKDAKKSGLKRREPKDPGIPNAWPFKQELIQQLAAQKERAAERMRKIKEESFKRASQVEELPGTQLAGIQKSATERANAFGSVTGTDVPTAHQDYSRRAYYKDFVAEAADVIIEVIDARDPEGGRCRDVERFVRSKGANKKVVLLLNKIDLVPKPVLTAWLKHLREELPTIPFKASTQQQAQNLGRRSSAAQADAKGSDCIGADMLLQLLKNYARNAGLKSALTVGVVGLPNVGKSSVINSLKRSRVAQVGNTPGVTRGVQEVHLDKQITLLDSPGVVFAEPGKDGLAAAALRNCVKVEQLDDPVLPVVELVRRCPKKQLTMIYNIGTFNDADEFLQLIATSRGKLKKGGRVDVEVAGSAAVVSEFAADFSVEELNEDSLLAQLPGGAGKGFAIDSFGQLEVDLEGAAAESSEEELMEGSEEESGSEFSDEDEDLMDDDDEEPETKASKKYDWGGAGATLASVMGEVEQTKVLYSNPGQYNPHAARAAKKQRKKAAVKAEDDGSDFDFEEDWSDEGMDE